METQLLAEYLFDEWSKINSKNDENFRCIVSIPILSIDNIECCTMIKIFTKSFKLIIDTHKEILYKNTDDENFIESSAENLYTKEFHINDEIVSADYIKSIIDEWFREIELLKFDVLRSMFTVENNMFDFLRKIKNIKIGTECCICSELTRNKTICEHSVCIPCLIKIKCDEDGTTLCPLCREEIAR